MVVKPLDGNHGRGVTLDIDSAEKLGAAFEEARSRSRRVIVEQQFRGRDYLVLVVGGEVCAVAERVPAHVTGDSRLSIAGLAENRDSRRREGHEKVMTRIIIDDHVRARLERAGLTPDSVPRQASRSFCAASRTFPPAALPSTARLRSIPRTPCWPPVPRR